MKYKITHTTTYDYSSQVTVCHNIVNLTPRNDGRVQRHSHRLMIRPTTRNIVKRVDVFGNLSHRFSVEEHHKSLSIKSVSRVDVSVDPSAGAGQDVAWDQVLEGLREGTDPCWLKAAPFQFSSPRIPIDPLYREYAQTAFGQNLGIVESVKQLTSKIYTDFAYDPVATHVGSTVADAFGKRRGVCQDFAHIQLACLRSLGIPARYVSGYLKTSRSDESRQMVGADQSHAWVSAYCGEKLGWLEFDPTNDCRGDLNHIPIAWGRDYGDVVPVRGVFLGGGKHALKVTVHVEEYDQEGDREPEDAKD